MRCFLLAVALVCPALADVREPEPRIPFDELASEPMVPLSTKTRPNRNKKLNPTIYVPAPVMPVSNFGFHSKPVTNLDSERSWRLWYSIMHATRCMSPDCLAIRNATSMMKVYNKHLFREHQEEHRRLARRKHPIPSSN